ncbi:MAG: 4Fe-4S dicluster domain-containing protein [Calditrichaeota bacterium]|nr:MAG: 4Fe-4S dicluster domain-containing protein [Calditrichota bacterium]
MAHPGDKLVPRKKKPKVIAVVDQHGCTGCEVCLDVCPTEAIIKVEDPEGIRAIGVCEVEYDLCIGCKKCAQDCPWETITMFDTKEWEAVNFELLA